MVELILNRSVLKPTQYELNEALHDTMEQKTTRIYEFYRFTPEEKERSIIKSNIVRLLLENGADPNANVLNFSVLIKLAILRLSEDQIRIFLQYGADPLHCKKSYKNLGYDNPWEKYSTQESPLEMAKDDLDRLKKYILRPEFTTEPRQEVYFKMLAERQNIFEMLYDATMNMYIVPFNKMLDKLLNLPNLSGAFIEELYFLKRIVTPFNYFEMVNKFLVALNQCRDWLLAFKADASVLADFFQLKGDQIRNPILIDVVVKALEKLVSPEISSEYSRQYGLFKCKKEEIKSIVIPQSMSEKESNGKQPSI